MSKRIILSERDLINYIKKSVLNEISLNTAANAVRKANNIVGRRTTIDEYTKLTNKDANTLYAVIRQ